MTRKNTKITMLKNDRRAKQFFFKTQDHGDQKEHHKTSNKKEHKNISIQRYNKTTMILRPKTMMNEIISEPITIDF